MSPKHTTSTEALRKPLVRTSRSLWARNDGGGADFPQAPRGQAQRGPAQRSGDRGLWGQQSQGTEPGSLVLDLTAGRVPLGLNQMDGVGKLTLIIEKIIQIGRGETAKHLTESDLSPAPSWSRLQDWGPEQRAEWALLGRIPGSMPCKLPTLPEVPIPWLRSTVAVEPAATMGLVQESAV